MITQSITMSKAYEKWTTCYTCGGMRNYDGLMFKICKCDETGFGTEYHDGSGFADCDPKGTGNRLCKGLPKSQMCSECIYLSTFK